MAAGVDGAAIGGGRDNAIQDGASYAAIMGGFANTNSTNAAYATVAGGRDNVAGAAFSFAAGRRAKANHPGSLVWGDSSDADIGSTTSNQVTLRANGGVRLSAAAGAAKFISVGERYRDNAIVAWARVSATAGSGNTEFGITSVSRASPGVYNIVTDAAAASTATLIPIAIAEVNAPPTNSAGMRIVSVNQSSANSFSVFINNGTGALVDNDFVFMVTAR